MSKKIGKRRGQANIIMGILSAAAGEGASKTAIVYEIGFNFERVNKYIELMISKGFIEQVESGSSFSLYKRTEKGEQALKKLEDAETFVFGEEETARQDGGRVLA